MHAAVANLMLEVGALVVVAALFTGLLELVDIFRFMARAINFYSFVDVCLYEWRVESYIDTYIYTAINVNKKRKEPVGFVENQHQLPALRGQPQPQTIFLHSGQRRKQVWRTEEYSQWWCRQNAVKFSLSTWRTAKRIRNRAATNASKSAAKFRTTYWTDYHKFRDGLVDYESSWTPPMRDILTITDDDDLMATVGNAAGNAKTAKRFTLNVRMPNSKIVTVVLRRNA